MHSTTLESFLLHAQDLQVSWNKLLFMTARHISTLSATQMLVVRPVSNSTALRTVFGEVTSTASLGRRMQHLPALCTSCTLNVQDGLYLPPCHVHPFKLCLCVDVLCRLRSVQSGEGAV